MEPWSEADVTLCYLACCCYIMLCYISQVANTSGSEATALHPLYLLTGLSHTHIWTSEQPISAVCGRGSGGVQRRRRGRGELPLACELSNRCSTYIDMHFTALASRSAAEGALP